MSFHRLILLITFFCCLSFPNFIHAQDNSNLRAEARIDQILEEKEVTFDQTNQMISPDNNCRSNPNCEIQTYQKMTATLQNTDQAGTVVTVINGDNPSPLKNVYKVGDQVILESAGNFIEPTEGSTEENNQNLPTFYINDYVRRNEIFILFAVFLIISIIVTRLKGIKAIIGMFYSFLILIKVTIPLIMVGHNPFLVALLTIVLILPPTFYFSHGFNRKANAALVGTSIALIITISLAYLAVIGVKLTGFASEESNFIVSLMGNTINIRGLLIAGIMISALGTLNDVTVSQAAVVAELKKENPRLTITETYQKSMNVGQDHIVSMIDTLILVYAGGSLPLLILLSDGSQPLSQVMNYEMIATEIVNMLVGSIGLILAVPITTFVACLFFEET